MYPTVLLWTMENFGKCATSEPAPDKKRGVSETIVKTDEKRKPHEPAVEIGAEKRF